MFIAFILITKTKSAPNCIGFDSLFDWLKKQKSGGFMTTTVMTSPVFIKKILLKFFLYAIF